MSTFFLRWMQAFKESVENKDSKGYLGHREHQVNYKLLIRRAPGMSSKTIGYNLFCWQIWQANNWANKLANQIDHLRITNEIVHWKDDRVNEELWEYREQPAFKANKASKVYEGFRYVLQAIWAFVGKGCFIYPHLLMLYCRVRRANKVNGANVGWPEHRVFKGNLSMLFHVNRWIPLKLDDSCVDSRDFKGHKASKGIKV